VVVYIGIVVGMSTGRAKLREGDFHIGITDAGEALAGRTGNGDRGQALRGIAPVPGEVGSSQALQEWSLRRVKVAQDDEVLGQGPGLVAGPSVERCDQLRLVDQAVLEREQSEEKVARWVRSRWHGCGLSIETSQTGDKAEGLQVIERPKRRCKKSMITAYRPDDSVDEFGASGSNPRANSPARCGISDVPVRSPGVKSRYFQLTPLSRPRDRQHGRDSLGNRV